VPRSVEELSALVDYHVELKNITGADDIELVTPNATWQSFTQQWIQYVFRSLLPCYIGIYSHLFRIAIRQDLRLGSKESQSAAIAAEV
jgi:hypothetical protein